MSDEPVDSEEKDTVDEERGVILVSDSISYVQLIVTWIGMMIVYGLCVKYRIIQPTVELRNDGIGFIVIIVFITMLLTLYLVSVFTNREDKKTRHHDKDE
jgi:hypothetical protein